MTDHKVEWTNWTFGFWWGRIGRWRCIGVELGPLQLMWKRNP